EWRRNAQHEMENARMFRPNWETMRIEEARDPSLNGRTVAELATERGVSALDAMIEISIAEDFAPRFRDTIANDDPAVIADLLTQDGLVLGLSDAGAHVGQLCDACLPTDLLGNWVRER